MIREGQRQCVVVEFPDGGHVVIPVEWTELRPSRPPLRHGKRAARLHPEALLEVVARVRDLLSTIPADRSRQKLAHDPGGAKLGPTDEGPGPDLQPDVGERATRAARNAREPGPQARRQRSRTRGIR